jgi:hypothetical protein
LTRICFLKNKAHNKMQIQSIIEEKHRMGHFWGDDFMMQWFFEPVF